jgi:hypothetical protein
MTAAMFQGEGGYMSAVGQKMHTRLQGPPPALKEGSVGPTMSDLQFAMENERKQHQQAYNYAHGNHVGEQVPLGEASF